MERSIDLRPRAREGPIYKAIMEEIKWRIAGGSLRPGDRLPATRDLARTLDVDPNTVARAYSLLEREGVLDARQGRGTFVAAGLGSETLAAARDERLRAVVHNAITEALALGYDAEHVRAAFDTGFLSLKSATSTISFQGSHDPSLEILWALAARRQPGMRVRSSLVGSLWGLVALERGDAHLAGAHLLDPDSGEYNLPWIRRVLPGRKVALLRLGEREQGLMYRKEAGRTFRSLSDIAHPGVRFVNRQRGSGTRVLLDHYLAQHGIPSGQIGGYEREERTHSAVAAVIAGGAADVGLGLYSSARALDLGFSPIASEAYDLVALADMQERDWLAPLVDVLGAPEFRALLGSSGGYDTTHTGELRLFDT